MLRPTDKGNIAEAKIAARAIELGIGVSRPVTEGERYDLIFDLRLERCDLLPFVEFAEQATVHLCLAPAPEQPAGRRYNGRLL